MLQIAMYIKNTTDTNKILLKSLNAYLTKKHSGNCFPDYIHILVLITVCLYNLKLTS